MNRSQPTSEQHRRNARALQSIALPKPALKKRFTLAAALEHRRTIRDVSAKPLSLQTLSNLLWAAAGVNRANGPFGVRGRTAASASNSQEIDLYVAVKEGTYLYDPLRHYLDLVVPGDLRALAVGRGQHGLGAAAPVRLIYVADIDRLVHTSGYWASRSRNSEVVLLCRHRTDG